MRRAVWGGAVLAFALSAAFAIGPAEAARATACTSSGLCYCVESTLKPAIDEKVALIRGMIARAQAQGKAVGFVSIPLSTAAGSYFNVNLDVLREVKERLTAQFGASAAWVLSAGAPEFTLPDGANGADYMLIWTQVLEGADGNGAFDFVYFAGPSDFARHFKLDGHGDLEKLGAAYDRLAKSDPALRNTVDRRAFRDYYGLRASAAFSLGVHDEWNAVRALNEKRRAADPKWGIVRQIGVFFDGRPVAPGLMELPVSPGYAGACKE